jgi:hypothetical protein
MLARIAGQAVGGFSQLKSAWLWYGRRRLVSFVLSHTLSASIILTEELRRLKVRASFN